MRAWHFSENAYPYLPPAEEYHSIRVILAEPPLRSEERRRALRPLPRRVADRRGGRRQHHAQRASSERDLRRSRGAAGAGGAGARTKKARLLILGNPIANRRQPVRVAEEMALCRRAVARPARGRLRARRAVRDPAGNSNPVRMNERIGKRSTSSSRRGPAMTGRSASRAASSIIVRSISGRGLISRRIRRSGSARRRRAARRESARMAISRRRFSLATKARGRSTTPIGAAGARQAAARMCRRPFRLRGDGLCRRERSQSARRRRKDACGTSPPTRSHTSRSRPAKPAAVNVQMMLGDAGGGSAILGRGDRRRRGQCRDDVLRDAGQGV